MIGIEYLIMMYLMGRMNQFNEFANMEVSDPFTNDAPTQRYMTYMSEASDQDSVWQLSKVF